MQRCIYRCIVSCVFLLHDPAIALDGQLARTPPMGWNSWETLRLNIDEQAIRSVADALVRTGMKDAGYQYVVLDAGWKAAGRDAAGKLMADPRKFPTGIKALAGYVHSRGLKFGLYTDAGDRDCVAGSPGSRDHELLDAATFAEWGGDYLKEDWCNSQGLNAQRAYTKMSAAIRATARPMVFSICEWGDNQPWEWAGSVAHLWRTTGDNRACWDCGRESMNKPGGYPRGWTLILDAQVSLAKFAGPGHWNDPDLLEVGNPGLSVEESRAHFSLWSILAAPLMATNDPRLMRPEVADIFLNREVIDIDQDPAGREGTRLQSSNGLEIWMRELSDGSRAVVLFNRTRTAASIRVDWSRVGFSKGERIRVRDLWQHREMGNLKYGYSARVAAHGAVMLRLHANRK